MFTLKPDYEQVLARYEAWWEGAVVDRPLVTATLPRPPERRRPQPAAGHGSLRERWMDADYQAEVAVARLENTIYVGDALPVAYPNLGPEVFSAFYGCPLEFGERTSWSSPILRSWEREEVEGLRLDQESLYYRKILEITDALLEAGQGRFIVGYTDLHPGGDAVAAFRDPQNLCIDMIENPRAVRRLVDRVTGDFLRVFDAYHRRLAAAGMPSTTWLPAVCRGRMHVPSNDFSCMISAALFEDVFLPGIVCECRAMDRCVYHLDGPQALRFLDRLLEVPEIHAIQWVAGAGRDHWSDWVEVYRRIQAAGRAVCQMRVPVEELSRVFEALRPEGLWIDVAGVEDAETGRRVLQAVERWS